MSIGCRTGVESVEFKVVLKISAIKIIIFECNFLFWLCPKDPMWDPCCLTWDGTYATCIVRWSLNHWTTREVLLTQCFTYLFLKTY